jgi:hypothetical protein
MTYYVASIKIEKITPPAPLNVNTGRTPAVIEGNKRVVEEFAHVTLRADSLAELDAKVTGMLAVVTGKEA